jgi:5'-methylthioadenosine phosphorylase
MCYATIALPTDYDVWNEDDHVDVSSVMAVIKQNVENVRKVLKRVIPQIPLERELECDAHEALKYAIMTKPAAISQKTRDDLGIILGKYLG